jgi:hypothetical protein
VSWDTVSTRSKQCTTGASSFSLRNSACKIANLAKLLQLFILRNIAFQRKPVFLRRKVKDIRASLDL